MGGNSGGRELDGGDQLEAPVDLPTLTVRFPSPSEDIAVEAPEELSV